MYDTACGCECPFVKNGFCKTDKECPHYVESWWKEGKTGDQKLVRDCSPKRLLIQSNAQFNRMDGLQAAFDSQRNQFADIGMHFQKLMEEVNVLVAQQKSILQAITAAQTGEIGEKNEET